MKKAAVLFPGIGYHTDKPLLYYSKKIAAELGYEIIEVPYGKFPKGVKGSREKMEKAFFSALEQAGEILQNVDFSEYDDIVFISKSVGTAVASAYAGRHGLKTRNIYYTPVEASFQFMEQPGIVFTGTADAWVTFEAVKQGCETGGFPLYVTEDGNHSLETGAVKRDLENLREIMRITEEYIAGER
ncbi:MAG TPA: alpha/beta hydrolase [Candidatus Mediterraneibacter faecigallinarum]|uniref:Alpha/beta hydrolase n=1 Tax=Candidatus Mediterraneibacter faecigallinarum TaxID=2838669 RepID=A0A9D2NUQ2_9FIRM|nr:alpha/beta hydrolase [Candidatus Mediterraneibacter faecigallinarum]